MTHGFLSTVFYLHLQADSSADTPVPSSPEDRLIEGLRLIAEGSSIYKAFLVTKVPCEVLQEHLPQDAISSSTPGISSVG